MAVEKVPYGDGGSGNSQVKMTHCPFCRGELCNTGWATHIQERPECREAAYNRLEALAGDTHRRDIEDSQNGRETVQGTL